MTPGDSEAGTVSVSVTGVVAVVVSSREELMKEVVLEAEGLVVMGVWASCSPSTPSPPSGSLFTPVEESDQPPSSTPDHRALKPDLPSLALEPPASSSSPFTTSL